MNDEPMHTPGDYEPGYPYQPQPQPQPVSQPMPQPMPLPPAPPAPRRRGSGLAIVAAAVFGGIVGGAVASAALVTVLGLPPRGQQAAVRPVEPVVSVAPVVSPSGADAAQPIEAVAAKVTPSVVNVAIVRRAVDPFTGQTSEQKAGNGSGVIVRADGFILTNNHVVEGADRILVRIGLEDKPAKVIGTDPTTDIAVVKVEATGLPAIVTGDSDALKVGETVVAIGSPFGLDKTVTSGIISALHRSGDAGGNSNTYTNLIQTDAAINPGNSGGALADMSGRIVGINTLIQTGGAQQSAGIGFAIPIKLASLVAEQLIATGKARLWTRSSRRSSSPLSSRALSCRRSCPARPPTRPG
jgi:putative serine protease PepD